MLHRWFYPRNLHCGRGSGCCFLWGWDSGFGSGPVTGVDSSRTCCCRELPSYSFQRLRWLVPLSWTACAFGRCVLRWDPIASACKWVGLRVCWVSGCIRCCRVSGSAFEEGSPSGVAPESAQVSPLRGGWCCPFVILCDVLEELLENWSDVKICLAKDVLLMKKSINVVDLDSLLCSDRLGLPRLELLHVVLLCFRTNCAKLFDVSVKDYACRTFVDFCFFHF